jgi:hypothetical protein
MDDVVEFSHYSPQRIQSPLRIRPPPFTAACGVLVAAGNVANFVAPRVKDMVARLRPSRIYGRASLKLLHGIDHMAVSSSATTPVRASPVQQAKWEPDHRSRHDFLPNPCIENFVSQSIPKDRPSIGGRRRKSLNWGNPLKAESKCLPRNR